MDEESVVPGVNCISTLSKWKLSHMPRDGLVIETLDSVKRYRAVKAVLEPWLPIVFAIGQSRNDTKTK